LRSLLSLRPDAVAERGVSWRQRWLNWRDRTLSNTGFQRWAAGFPLTRAIARRRARQLFDLCAGFVYSQILLACVRLQLFERLRDGPETLATLATKTSLSIAAITRLVDAAVSLRLLERRTEQLVGLGPHGAALLGNPGIAAMIEHHPLLYADLNDPVALLRTLGQDTKLARYWAYAHAERPAALSSEQTHAYTELMSRSQPLVAQDILDAYPLDAHRCLLDVGGGDGTFLVSATNRTPQLRCILFDLPAVAARAQTRFAIAGLTERAQAVGGDFLSQALPKGADVISLIRVVHDHDDSAALKLLVAVRNALPEGGTVLIGEPMSGTPGAGGVGDAYFGFYLLAMGSGRPRTAPELQSLLRRAGFSRIRVIRTRQPLQTGLIVAHRN
jgi:demethylspheroidene O-methyltransferase